MSAWFVLLFVVGWVLHVYGQAQASVRSSSNGLTQVRQWFQLNWYVIAVRAFLACMTLLLWSEAPSLFGELVGRSIPMTKATCGIVGFGADELWNKLTFILGLKVEVPQAAPPAAKP